MRPRLVFVHGIGPARRAVDERARWVQALADGFRRAGHSALSVELIEGSCAEIVFAYYRDLFDPSETQGSGPWDLGQEEAAILTDLLREIVDLQLDESTDGQTRTVLEHARGHLAPTGQAQGTGDLVRRALNAATTLLSARPLRAAGQWASGKLMVGDLAQVARYLARGESDQDGRSLDDRIRAVVTANFGDGPVILVAHSLGTVVCYETLHEVPGPVPLFVTLGSPLAMRTVVWPRLRPQPPRTPESVERWLNFWDRDDIIVARPKLEGEIGANGRRVLAESTRVDSDGVWVHTATKYLAKPDVAGPIAEAIVNLAGAS